MKEKIIEFSAHKEYLEINEDFPKPIKVNIPAWFKKLNHNLDDITVKGCVPFLQTLVSGYLLTLPQSFHLKHNSFTKDMIKTTLSASVHEDLGYNLNIFSRAEQHPPKQVKGSPHLKKNSSLFVNKFLNPWKIKTPPGYSCLFLPPLNNADERFSIIPAIVDTDTFEMHINFPFIVNGDKFPVLDTQLKKGSPYVQVIPFKRDSWKMKIKSENRDDNIWQKSKYWLSNLHNYKNIFWNKDITWK